MPSRYGLQNEELNKPLYKWLRMRNSISAIEKKTKTHSLKNVLNDERQLNIVIIEDSQEEVPGHWTCSGHDSRFHEVNSHWPRKAFIREDKNQGKSDPDSNQIAMVFWCINGAFCSSQRWLLVTWAGLDWLSNLGKRKNFPLGSTGNYFSVVFALPWSMKPISFLGSGEFIQHDQFPVIVCCCHWEGGRATLLDHFDTKSCHLEIDQDIKLWAPNDSHRKMERLLSHGESGGAQGRSALTPALAAPTNEVQSWVTGVRSSHISLWRALAGPEEEWDMTGTVENNESHPPCCSVLPCQEPQVVRKSHQRGAVGFGGHLYREPIGQFLDFAGYVAQ